MHHSNYVCVCVCMCACSIECDQVLVVADEDRIGKVTVRMTRARVYSARHLRNGQGCYAWLSDEIGI